VDELGEPAGDTIGRAGEKLRAVRCSGKSWRTPADCPWRSRDLNLIRAHAQDAIGRLPAAVRAIDPLAVPYPRIVQRCALGPSIRDHTGISRSPTSGSES